MSYTHFARFYDALTRNVRYDVRARYFDRIFKRYGARPGLLLDLACGTGSLSLELAALGYDVIGVDASQDMLAVAGSKAADDGPRPLFLCQSMERLDLFGTVESCVCALDSLNHLPDMAALARVFARVALFLNPGGLFVFDVNTAYKHRHVLAGNTFVYDLPEVFCVWRNAYTAQDDRVDIALDFFVPQQKSGGYGRFSERFSERVFPPDSVAELLAANRFALLDCFGDDSFDEPGPETQRLVYVAKLGEE